MPPPTAFKFITNKDLSWPYKITYPYTYKWETKPLWKVNSQEHEIVSSQKTVARLKDNSITLSPGYAWDGSTLASDTPACMRASALHDAWCQTMKADAYQNNYKNWRRGATEYRMVCIQDGMSEPRAWFRWIVLAGYGVFRKY